MAHDGLPAPLAEGAMRILPPPLFARLLQALVCRMKRRHPRLFANLARLENAVIRIEPEGLPYPFVLRTGKTTEVLSLALQKMKKPDACIRGSLQELLDMLEGRSDGDTLFFSRDLVITGDTALIVALRNTLDREEIRPMEDILSLFGPFAKPAGRAVVILDRLARKIREEMAAA